MKENLVGKTLANRYHISELIGTGGMASVYKGECNLLNRDVAIKVLRDSVKDDAEALTSFKKEAQSAAKLSHNNIVSVFDIGEENGADYMVMEYVNGITLKKYIQENGPMPWQEACDFGIQIGQALEAAHGLGIVHRDIKPQNILVTEERELKVTDFGIAKAATTETLTVGGSAMGSVHYISPEQARGGYTDARSDIYSLGIVLFEMITGKVPFNSESAVSVALMHIEKEMPSVLAYNPQVPTDLARVISRATAKEQISRYESVTELINDLRAVLASQPIEEPEIIDGGLGDTRKFTLDGIEESEPAKKAKKVKKPKTAEEKQADKRATVLALLTVAVLVLVAALGWSLIKRTTGEVMVPDFKNMTIEEAQELAEKKNIEISDELEFSLSDDVEEGKIISQTPEANTYMSKTDNTVHLVVSIGSSGGDISVPFVKGAQVEDAIEKILNAGLTYILNEESSTSVALGKVIRQSPEVGTKLNKDDVVTIHVSSGPPEEIATPIIMNSIPVPSLAGATQAEAEIALNQVGLKLISVSKKDSNAPAGTIISQSPDAGKTVTQGAGVSVVISTGIATDDVFVPPTIAPTKSPAATEQPTGEDGKVPVEDGGNVTKPYTFQMPEGEGSANVKITVDGDTHYEKVKNYGDVVSVDITGRGKVKVVTYVNGKVADEEIIVLE